jgi:hypothetical protein
MEQGTMSKRKRTDILPLSATPRPSRKKAPPRDLSDAELEFCEEVENNAPYCEFATDFLREWTDPEKSPIDQMRHEIEVVRDDLEFLEAAIDTLEESYKQSPYPQPPHVELDDEDDEPSDPITSSHGKATPMEIPKEVEEVAWKIREQFRDRGEFTQDEYRSALAIALRTYADIAYEGFVDDVATLIDSQSKTK